MKIVINNTIIFCVVFHDGMYFFVVVLGSYNYYKTPKQPQKIHTIMKYNAELCEQAVLISFAFLFRDIQSKPDYIVLPLLPVFLSTLAEDQYNTLKGIPQAFLCSTLSLSSGGSRRGGRGARPPLYLDQTEARRAEKKIFETSPPPLISVSG